ncbi:MAG: aldo/keto reductase [Armatimonadetes bacterium]|nr:aldo/keto reductase [Armatimonadota bacterium]
MEYRHLGRSGLKVPPLCIGTMTWGISTDQAEADRIVDAALDQGATFFDTADVYTNGVSEEILGRALARDGKRDRCVVATKFAGAMGKGPNDGGASRYHMMAACEASLRRLGTDHADLYYVHVMDLSTPLDEILQGLDDLVRQGKVRYLGTSKWVPSLVTEAVMLSARCGWNRFVAEQPPYNLLDRGIERELVWTALRHGIGLCTFAPLGTSILSGQYESPDDRRPGSRNERGLGPSRMNEAAVARAKALTPLAEARGLTLAQFALAWVRQQPAITAPVLGVRKLDHLLSALAAVDARLTAEELDRVDEIAPPGSAVSDYWDGNTFRRLRREITK